MRIAILSPMLICGLWCSIARSDTIEGEAKRNVSAFRDAVVVWIEAIGTPAEERLHKAMESQRDRVIAHGPLAIPHVKPLLKDEQVNVRRGAAIALLFIVERNKVHDEKLLDGVLLRMVEDTDIKTRSNLYHVVNALIANSDSGNEADSDESK
jgi:hypothetical protein